MILAIVPAPSIDVVSEPRLARATFEPRGQLLHRASVVLCGQYQASIRAVEQATLGRRPSPGVATTMKNGPAVPWAI